MACLYQLAFPSGKSYVGVSATTARERFYRHAYLARNGSNCAVHKAIRKYGVESVEVRTLVVGASDYLFDLERRAIAALSTKVPAGYNLTDGGEGPNGMTEEARRKISQAIRGCVRSPAQRAAVAAAQRGRVHTPEHRAKVGAAQRGRPKSPEAIAKRTATRRAKYGAAYCGS